MRKREQTWASSWTKSRSIWTSPPTAKKTIHLRERCFLVFAFWYWFALYFCEHSNRRMLFETRRTRSLLTNTHSHKQTRIHHDRNRHKWRWQMKEGRNEGKREGECEGARSKYKMTNNKLSLLDINVLRLLSKFRWASRQSRPGQRTSNSHRMVLNVIAGQFPNCRDSRPTADSIDLNQIHPEGIIIHQSEILPRCPKGVLIREVNDLGHSLLRGFPIEQQMIISKILPFNCAWKKMRI